MDWVVDDGDEVYLLNRVEIEDLMEKTEKEGKWKLNGEKSYLLLRGDELYVNNISGFDLVYRPINLRLNLGKLKIESSYFSYTNSNFIKKVYFSKVFFTFGKFFIDYDICEKLFREDVDLLYFYPNSSYVETTYLAEWLINRYENKKTKLKISDCLCGGMRECSLQYRLQSLQN